MRFTAAALAAAAMLAFAGAASAQTLQPASFSPEFQGKLEREYGVREGAYLRSAVDRAISQALARRGVAQAGDIDVEIIDARPNRPTFRQLSDTPGLSMSSISIGGAELRAVIRRAGAAPETISHRYYSHDLAYASFGAGTWSDARRSIRGFAEKVADAYIAQAR